MKFSASQIAQLIEGEVIGNSEAQVSGLSKIEEGKKGTLSFLANLAYKEYIYSTEATIVIVSKSFEADRSLPDSCTLIVVEDAYSGFARLLELYNEVKYDRKGIAPEAVVADDAQIGDDVYIGAHVVIDSGAKIESGSKIFPHSYIGVNAKIGKNTLIHAGVRILADCEIGD